MRGSNPPIPDADLLALIERELDPSAEAALRARLASDPALLRMVDQLIEDRTALRNAPSPATPPLSPAVLEQCEGLAARPMLLDDPPPPLTVDAPRRRATTRQRRRWAGPLLAAACLGFAAAGAFWFGASPAGDRMMAMITGASSTDTPDDLDAVRPTPDPSIDRADDSETMIAAAPMTPTDVDRHHVQPTLTPAPDRAADPMIARAGGLGAPQALSFKLVMQGASEDAARAAIESATIALVDARSDVAAVVSNFSLEEAAKLAEARQRVLARRAASQREAIANANANANGDDRVVPTPRGRSERAIFEEAMREAFGDDRSSMSRRLAGSKRLAAPAETQLDYSQHGAAYTLTIPAGELANVLASLRDAALRDGLSSMLAPLETTPATASDAVAQYRAVQAAIQALREQDPRTPVLLPIAIVSDADRSP